MTPQEALFTFIENLTVDQLLTLRNFSETEQQIIAIAFSDATVRKYLSTLAANEIRAFANLPLDVLSENSQLVLLKQAYLKGGLGMLQTLLSIEKPQPTTAPAQQQQNSPV